jgi:hypothetical protein
METIKSNNENPAAFKILKEVEVKFAEIKFNEAAEWAKKAEWPLVDTKVTVFISDGSILEKDRNITVECRVVPDVLEVTLRAALAKAIGEKKYMEPVVDSVRLETTGYTAEGTEIATGIYRNSTPVIK